MEPDGSRICEGCGASLTGRRRKWCSDECRQDGSRWAWILKTYGLTKADFEAIWEHQQGQCPICLRDLRETSGLNHIDHEHGAHVRGIVCAYDNTRIIGRLKDHETAQRLADYLREPPAVAALGRKVIAPGRTPRKRRRRRR